MIYNIVYQYYKFNKIKLKNPIFKLNDKILYFR